MPGSCGLHSGLLWKYFLFPILLKGIMALLPWIFYRINSGFIGI